MVLVIGEAMLELQLRQPFGNSSQVETILSYGGDTLNTAIYMSRLGIETDYLTGLGDDESSDWMKAQWNKEGIGTAHIDTFENARPGLYLVKIDEKGERTFLYWRKDSPVRRMFETEGRLIRLCEKVKNIQHVYLSGITLALFEGEDRQRLFAFISKLRDKGAKVVFDGNYRPSLWVSEHAAREAYLQMYKITDIVLPTLDDELLLFGGTKDDAIKRFQECGVDEIVVKLGGEGCQVMANGQTRIIETVCVQPVDTTSAGDSFNAAYLSARVAGKNPFESAAMGHRLAGEVIMHRGAIIPKVSMPEDLISEISPDRVFHALN